MSVIQIRGRGKVREEDRSSFKVLLPSRDSSCAHCIFVPPSPSALLVVSSPALSLLLVCCRNERDARFAVGEISQGQRGTNKKKKKKQRNKCLLEKERERDSSLAANSIPLRSGIINPVPLYLLHQRS